MARVQLHAPPLPVTSPGRRRRAGSVDTAATDATALAAITAGAFGVPAAALARRGRGAAPVAFARQVAMYLAHVHLGLTMSATAALFGRDRTTVAHACRRVEDRRDEPAIDRLVDGITAEFDRRPARSAAR